MDNKPKIVVGLSGGVDSSVAALLLKRAGFNVLGVYLKCYWTYEGCQSDLDRNSAAKVASFLNIPFEVWDFEKEYRQRVVEYFYREYEAGRTPNPDVVCNREIKFGLFAKKALEKQNTLYIATGHYARIGLEVRSKGLEASGKGKIMTFPKFSQEEMVSDGDGIKYVHIREYIRKTEDIKRSDYKGAGISGKYSLFGGVDVKKDQSYFLYDIDKSIIEHILFPLGNFTKIQVRSIARDAGLPTAERPDSTGICFIGDINVEKFLKERIKEHKGNVVTKSGELIGKHKGVEFYTIGQRHGFEITNNKSQAINKIQNPKIKDNSSQLPYYVIGKNVEKNELMVGMGEECKTQKFSVKITGKLQAPNYKLQTNSKSQIQNEKNLFVRIRNLGEFIPCELEVRNEKLEVKLTWPVFGVAPGQSAVFYKVVGNRSLGDMQKEDLLGPYNLKPKTSNTLWQVLGGGVIE